MYSKPQIHAEQAAYWTNSTETQNRNYNPPSIPLSYKSEYLYTKQTSLVLFQIYGDGRIHVNKIASISF